MASKRNMADSAQLGQLEKVEDDSFTSHLAFGLNQLREHGTFCDVNIIVDKQHFKAHKAVLSASSTYFESMFTRGVQESSSSEVNIQEGSAESFAQLIKFAYTGFFHLSAANVIGVFKMASFMGFSHAIKSCANYLSNQISEMSLEDAFTILTIAEGQQDLEDLIKELRLHLVHNFVKFAANQFFLATVTKEFLIECLTSGEIETKTTSEEEILQSTLNWVRHDWEHRKVHAFDLLKKIRLGLVPVDRLKTILSDEILAITECKNLMEEVIQLHATKESATEPLNQSHPDMFANRNTVTVLLSVSALKGVRYFDDLSRSGIPPSFMWKKLNNFPVPFVEPILHVPINNAHTLVVANGDLYIGGIQTSDRPDVYRYQTFVRYNMESSKWEKLADMTGDHHFTIGIDMVELGGFIYAVGGFFFNLDSDLDGGSSKFIEKYDIGKDCWISCCELQGINSVSEIVAFNKKMIILCTDENADEAIYMYDPTSNKSCKVYHIAQLESDYERFDLSLQFVGLQVYKGICYMTRWSEVDNFGYNSDDCESRSDADQSVLEAESNPKVFQLICDLDSNSPSIVLGEEVPQTHPCRNNLIQAFCMDNKTVVHILGCRYKIKDGVVNETDLDQWQNIMKTSSSPVHVTFDRRPYDL